MYLKTVSVLFLNLGMLSSLWAQPVDSVAKENRQKQYNDYWEKRTSNLTTGWVLLGVGAAATAGSLAIISGRISSDYIGDATGELLLFGAGAGAMITSIPFFISAGSNKRKARLALKGEKVSLGNKTGQQLHYTAATFIIAL